MKQIRLIILMLLISITAKANLSSQHITENKNPVDYKFEIYPDAINNVNLVKFYIPAETFVKINLTDESYNDNKIKILADGEIDKGKYCEYFKTDPKTSTNKYLIKMEIYTNENGNVIFSKEIKLKVN